MRLSGNRGEWSELYALIKLLCLGRLYAADEKVERIENLYFPILRVLRNPNTEQQIDFLVRDDVVEVLCSGESVSKLSKTTLSRMSRLLYTGIYLGSDRAFEIEGAYDCMKELHIDRISAPSTDKTDITLQIHDVFTGYDPICGFSIKSELGSPPTLLNASKSTNFVYEISGITDDDMRRINSIDTRTKILDRIKEIQKCANLKYVRTQNDVFASNLMLVDSFMPDIIAAMLLDFYQNKATDCRSLVELLEKNDPIGYRRDGIYEYKFKKFLCSVALGMMPSTKWNGHDEANGGYVIVKKDGDVLAYHLYNRDAFETYLLNNTRLERASTTRHDFAVVYKNDNSFFVNLNLQVRFK